MSTSAPQSPSWPADHDWDALVAVEVSHQGAIEAAFDRADGFERLGELRLALNWLDRACELSGGPSPASSETRARLTHALEGGDR